MFPNQQGEPKELNELIDLGNFILEMSKASQIHSEIANSSLSSLHNLIINPDGEERVNTDWYEQNKDTLPPQIQQQHGGSFQSQPIQPPMAQQMYNTPMMPQVMQSTNPILMQATNIPFLFHTQT